jgi:hypothetical protein
VLRVLLVGRLDSVVHDARNRLTLSCSNQQPSMASHDWQPAAFHGQPRLATSSLPWPATTGNQQPSMASHDWQPAAFHGQPRLATSSLPWAATTGNQQPSMASHDWPRPPQRFPCLAWLALCGQLLLVVTTRDNLLMNLTVTTRDYLLMNLTVTTVPNRRGCHGNDERIRG